MKRYVPHFLWQTNLGLVLVLLWLWLTPTGTLRNVHWQPPQAQKTDFAAMIPALPSIVSADTSQFIAMLDRPLFSMTRRPPPSVAAEATVDNMSTALLSGVFQGHEGGTIILSIAGKNRRVRLNESVDGWTIQSIQGRDVTFARSGQTRILRLPRATLTTYTGAAMPPAALAQGSSPQQRIESTDLPAQTPPKAAPRASFGGGR